MVGHAFVTCGYMSVISLLFTCFSKLGFLLGSMVPRKIQIWASKTEKMGRYNYSLNPLSATLTRNPNPTRLLAPIVVVVDVLKERIWTLKQIWRAKTIVQQLFCSVKKMENKMEDSIRAKMESLRMVREKEIPVQQQNMEFFADSFRKSLESITERSRENALNQGELCILFNLLWNEFGCEMVSFWSVQICNR